MHWPPARKGGVPPYPDAVAVVAPIRGHDCCLGLFCDRGLLRRSSFSMPEALAPASDHRSQVRHGFLALASGSIPIDQLAASHTLGQ